MAFGRQMDDSVHLLFLHQGKERLEVADVHLHEPVVRLVFQILQVCKITGIGQFVDIDYPVVRILVDEEPDHM